MLILELYRVELSTYINKVAPLVRLITAILSQLMKTNAEQELSRNNGQALRLITQSMATPLLNLIGLTNFLRRTDMVKCYLCGKPLKENEVIPYQERQICDECEYRLEVDD